MVWLYVALKELAMSNIIVSNVVVIVKNCLDVAYMLTKTNDNLIS